MDEKSMNETACVGSVTRRGFVVGAMAATATSSLHGADATDRDVIQKEIDAIQPKDYFAHLRAGPNMSAEARDAAYARWPILRRYDAAFEKVMREARETTVEDRPAIWYVYNMGVVVKTRQSLFSIDLCHRLAPAFADALDFAIISHNHGDHFTQDFYRAMDGRHKTVFSNFADNYGACLGHKGLGGFSRGECTYQIRDVTVRTYQSDHNTLLRGFVMPVEVNVGDYTILHNGDTFNTQDLRPTRTPDIWIHHAYCWGSKDGSSETVRGIRAFHPRLTVVAHHQELGHSIGNARWTFAKADARKAAAEAEGAVAVVPFWGDRLV